MVSAPTAATLQERSSFEFDLLSSAVPSLQLPFACDQDLLKHRAGRGRVCKLQEHQQQRRKVLEFELALLDELYFQVGDRCHERLCRRTTTVVVRQNLGGVGSDQLQVEAGRIEQAPMDAAPDNM